MKQRFGSWWVLLALFLVAVGFVAAGDSAAAPTAGCERAAGCPVYEVINLGTLPGGSSSYARAVNELGQVVGQASAAGGVQHAFLWLPEAAYELAAGMNDLGTLANGHSQAEGINDIGYVVGHSEANDDYDHAFLWRPGMGMVDLGTLGGSASEGYGINNAGQVVGAANSISDDWYAFIWADDQMNPLDVLNQEDTYNEAKAVNEAGMVAGVSSVEFATNRAVVWAEGVPTNLGTLGGDDSEAFGLNEAGQVVGASVTGDERLSGFLWLPAGAYGLPAGMNDVTPDANQAQLYGINNQGQAVGYGVYDTYNGAILWDAGATYYLDDLIDPNAGWHLNIAHDINDVGQIVGVGTFNGEARAFLLTPADPDPDPSLTLHLYLPAIVQ